MKMVLNKFPTAGGVITDATTRINNNNGVTLRQSGLNMIRSLQDRAIALSADGGEFADAYVDLDGRLDSVASATASFDTDKYKTTNVIAITIEATSISSIGDFAINDCVIELLSAGKWQLSCTTGTDEEKRAKIYKTLFYGTDGTDARASSTYITGITALGTTTSRDVGKRAYFYKMAVAGTGNYYDTATFDNTTTNTNISSWTAASVAGDWRIPSGTSLITGNTMGTDQTAKEVDNQTDCRMQLNYTGGAANFAVIFLTNGGISSWTTVGTATRTQIDFFTDNSIPVLTAATGTTNSNEITHDIPTGTFSSTISSSFGTALVEDWEVGANIQYKLKNGSDDSGWLAYNEVSEFTAFSSEPTELVVKLVPKTTSPTAGYPSINGFSVFE